MDTKQTWTNATVLCAAADQAGIQQALADTSLFTSLASADGNLPAVECFSSGPFANSLLDTMTAKEFPYSIKVRTPDWQQALADEGLVMIVQNPIANEIQ